MLSTIMNIKKKNSKRKKLSIIFTQIIFFIISVPNMFQVSGIIFILSEDMKLNHFI